MRPALRPEPPSTTLDRRRLLRLAGALGAGCAPVLAGGDAVRSSAALFQLAEGAHPYFVAGHAALLYLWAPLVVASACLLVLAPGLLLALAFDSAPRPATWVLHGLGLSLPVVSAAAWVAERIAGQPLRGSLFAALLIALSAVCLALVALRLRRAPPSAWPLAEPRAPGTLVAVAAGPLLVLAALAPKFYWEPFNGDGAHAYESARLLLFQAFPFWSREAGGGVSGLPGVTSMLFTYPAAWFIRLFGEVEASARLPFVLYMGALYAAVLALAERGRTRLGWVERGLLWLGLAVYAVVVAFSATYNPYAADIALPATQDTLLVVCFLGFVLAFVDERPAWMLLFLALTYLSLPSGALLVGLWLGAAALLWRPRPWRGILLAGAGVVALALLDAVAPRVLGALHLPPPGREYESESLLRRFAYVQWADWRRFAFLAVPGGILPAASLLAWRRQDPLARTLTIVTALYFVFFYFQYRLALHHFIPAMLLPLVVFWRTAPEASGRLRRGVLAATALAGLAALWLSLPADAGPRMEPRWVGSLLEHRTPGYDRLDPRVFRRAELLERLFPMDWDRRVPAQSYGGSPLVWNHYAYAAGPGRRANYVLQDAGAPPPPGMERVAQEAGAALYVRDRALWGRQLALRPPTPAGSSLFAVHRATLFPLLRYQLEDVPRLVRVKDVLAALRAGVGAGGEKEGRPKER